LQRLMEISRPGSRENPFQPGSQARNALIIDLLYAVGVRRAELLKSRVSHFVMGRYPTIRVLRRPDDPEDPRPNQPQAKTRERNLEIGNPLAERLQEYILEDRCRLPNAKKSPFLFLARDGKPLALGTLNKLFAQIVVRHPDFSHLLSPHILRHTFNDEFSRIAKAKGLSVEATNDQRNYLNGWSPNSSEGRRYNKRFIAEESQETLLDHQQQIFRDVEDP
jgi:integrase